MRTTDDLGAAVALPDRPARIVSLVPNLSEVLWTWGLADRVVGVTDWCVAPADGFPRAVRVRGTKNPDLSAVVDLAPDLVVANEEENREFDVRRLRDAGLAVYVTRVRTVHDAADSLARLGTVVGATGAGASLRADLLAAVARTDPAGPPVRVFCPVWRDPWMAVGSATFAGDLLVRCGGAVLPGDPDARYPAVTLDDVARHDPDLVLLPDEPYPFGPADRDAFRDWRGHVELVDGALLTWWGPRTPAAIRVLSRLTEGARR